MTREIAFESLVIGQEIPEQYRLVSQEDINRWAEVVGDYNPLHVDPEYAKTTKFKTTIAHGPLLISFISEAVGMWIGDSWIDGGQLLGVRFDAPVKPGDKISIGGNIINKYANGVAKVLECAVYIRNEAGTKIVSGTAKVSMH